MRPSRRGEPAHLPTTTTNTPAIASASTPSQAADVFERLAAHGRGTSKLSQDEFRHMLAALTEDENAAELLQLLITRKKARAQQARAAEASKFED